MTRRYAIQKLLEHGGLTRKEIIEITGWTTKQVHSALSYLSAVGLIEKQNKLWILYE